MPDSDVFFILHSFYTPLSGSGLLICILILLYLNRIQYDFSVFNPFNRGFKMKKQYVPSADQDQSKVKTY